MDLRYPIGKYETKVALSMSERAEAIFQISEAPKHLRNAVAGLTLQLELEYCRIARAVGQSAPGLFTTFQFQPHEFLHPVQTCVDGERADD